MGNKKTATQEVEGQESFDEQTALAEQTENKMTQLDDAYFTQNANVGLEEVTAEDMPTPTLTLVQKTSKITDDDGRPFAPGSFYYKATRKVFDEVEVSMLVFTKQELPTFDKKGKELTYIFLGAIMPDLMPFKMYLRSTGIGASKQFLGEVKALKKPMYALRVKLYADKRTNEFGDYYVPQFKIMGLHEPTATIMLEELVRTYSEQRQKVHEEVRQETNPDTDRPF